MANIPKAPAVAQAPTPYHHGDLRAELIRVGVESLAAGGVAEFSLRAVGRTIGVSASAPYRHFPHKEALLQAIAAAGYQQLADQLAADEVEAGKAARRVERFARRNPAWWEVMIRERAVDEGELERSRARFLTELVAAVERGGKSRDPEAAIRKAVVIWSGIVGLTRLRADGAFGLLEEWMVPTAGELAVAVATSRLPRPILAPRQ